MYLTLVYSQVTHLLHVTIEYCKVLDGRLFVISYLDNLFAYNIGTTPSINSEYTSYINDKTP